MLTSEEPYQDMPLMQVFFSVDVAMTMILTTTITLHFPIIHAINRLLSALSAMVYDLPSPNLMPHLHTRT
jgi:hypothetical protein